ncbi:transglutaminase family protein [Salipiger mangrovisoli]|uniref:Transglutaminase family protein n=1 Tax=Salipiger mangrovisoli TaxID=2865933 RepID=A0ABR9X3U8_9RHOB|nr:transglutaminase family protein [Salipiger mangrovisoli]MBE9638263.1 transglutaminase family protein [Salipiger mangrovisoli]
MRLSIRHITRYRFDEPVRGIVQSQKLWPADCASQRVLAWTVTSHGAQTGAEFVDGAGDMIRLATWRGPLTELTVEVEGEVETADLYGVLREHRERIPPSAYLRPTRQVEADAELKMLSAVALKGLDGASALDRAHALSRAVSEAIAYKPGETQPHTTASEALSGGVGVCQDHAHALISVAHVAEMPARYVTGYLQASADGSPHEASHAWAEIWVPELGWVGFDAANACCPDARYVRLGSGYDALDAAPIRGLVQGATPEEHLDVEVMVTAVQSGQQQQQ